MRLKVRRQRVRSVLGMLLAAAVLAAVCWGGCLAYSSAMGLAHKASRPDWTYWRAKGIKVRGLPAQQSVDVSDFAAPEPGRVYLSSDCAKLQYRLSEQFPYLRKIRVHRNWLTRNMVVSALLRKPVGLISAADRQVYADESGELYSMSGSTEPARLLSVRLDSLPPSRRLKPELAALLNYIDANIPLFPATPVELRQPDSGEVSLRLEDGSVVDWGNFAYAREKLDRLKAVFDMAKARIQGPLRINMTNFEDGSIPVSALDPRQG
ncbi:MAG: hypothetical protein GX410_05180 [Elusimicrobia bacterium]|nr:hypothetical protein [Elusimicrobiota bacterium]